MQNPLPKNKKGETLLLASEMDGKQILRNVLASDACCEVQKKTKDELLKEKKKDSKVKEKELEELLLYMFSGILDLVWRL